ncbi:MAG: chemotaxis protein CheA [Gammaproteobacteria bacterium]|nr:chemotaxis protein CheA [Gammaproteobacteria bacterium]
MAIDTNDEILQDFLVEAGEILELLGEQLVELEHTPEDEELLNAVFRGFHTIKGGAGFLALNAMVDVCHRCEDVFNILRQGDRTVDAELMDSVLQVLDILNIQFGQIRSGEDPIAASPELLEALEELAVITPAEASPSEQDTAEPSVTESAVEVQQADASVSEASDEGDITDAEFEALLDHAQAQSSLNTEKSGATEASEAGAESGDEITEEEFDKLLDELHGSGKSTTVEKQQDTSTGQSAEVSASADTARNEITEDEFETLLDNMQAEGKGAFAKKAVDSAGEKPGKEARVSTDKVKVSAKVDDKPVKKDTAAKQPVKIAEATVRVDTKRLDDIMNMVGELVLVRNRMDRLESSLGNEEVSQAVANLDIVTSDIQAAVMKTRMQPVKKVFGRFPRVVRDLARNLKKEVDLELVGEDTDLDKNLVEALADPLVHLVRNSVDHGIEMPDVREKAGKPRNGKVVLSAAQQGDHILLTIKDDGAGMDPNKLREIAIEKGVMDVDSAGRLNDKECFNLIFAPGFSTKAEISDISGRGVGMDVVKTRIVQLNGSVDINSELGKGTCISVKLPLTLAILPTLMVKIGTRTYALPLTSVHEIFHLSGSQTNTVDGQLVVMVRDKAMPMFYLQDWLARGADESEGHENDQVVVANIGNQRVGFVVNQVLGQEEVVIKPLGAMLHGLPGFAGATITGDGRIALILDMPSLLQAHGV